MYQVEPRVARDDASYLFMLAVFHYVMAGFLILFSLAGLVYIGMGVLFLVMPEAMNDGPGGPGEPPPEVVRYMASGVMFAFGAVFIGSLAGFGVLQILVGNALRARKWWLFCLIVSGLNCLNTPFGTALGVFTFVVLFRPSVKETFLNPVIGR
jgi:hypothetical protein